MFNILQGFDHLQFAYLAYNTEKIWQESNFCCRYGGEFFFKYTQARKTTLKLCICEKALVVWFNSTSFSPWKLI